MNVLFLTLVATDDIGILGIYNDLLREFHKYNHRLYIVSPCERRNKQSTTLKQEDGVNYLRVWTLNYQKTNPFEKGVSTLLIERQFKHAIKKYFSDIKFDLVLYTTPPITFASVVDYIKHRDNAFAYLLLKDIFPQNAVDLNLIKKGGLLHRYFRHKEEQLYNVSDAIGCMSMANVKYILNNNNFVLDSKVEVCPNSINVSEHLSLIEKNKEIIRDKYSIPYDKTIYVYGGNLGKPQNIPYIIDCLRFECKNPDAYFVIIGSGTEYEKLERFVEAEKPENVKLLKYMPNADFDCLVAGCDAGLIFLDHRFSIPNYPSRLLSYMVAGIPIVCATDKNTDIGEFIEDNKIGVWCESDTAQSLHNALSRLKEIKIEKDHILSVLRDSFDVSISYTTIISRIHESYR